MAKGSVEYGRGVKLELDPGGNWFVRNAGEVLPLSQRPDFMRVWTLLERPYDEVRQRTEEMAAASGVMAPFPFVPLLDSALRSQQVAWIDAALDWLPSLSTDDLAQLQPALAEIRDAEWAGQNLRHRAKTLAQRAAL